MKILFGLNNDDTVKAIVKYYEETYKEKVVFIKKKAEIDRILTD